MDDYGNGIPRREETPDSPQDESRLSRVLLFLPAVGFAVYSLLLFLLYLAPLEAFTSVNFYQAQLGICTAFIVFAALSLTVALAGLVLLPFPFFDLAKTKLSNAAPALRKAWRYLPLFFYFILYSLSCALTGTLSILSSYEPGMGAGAPLVLSFTIVFALIHIVCLLLSKFKK